MSKTQSLHSFQHRPVGRSTHAPRTAYAHMRYIMREEACTHFEAENMPEGENAQRGYFDRMANAKGEHASARVCDKLIIALPKELSAEQRHEVVREFMRDIGHGRVAWAAAHHDRGEDAANPHAHVVFRDRDIETNRRVMGTTTSRSEVKEAVVNGWKPPPMMSTKDMRNAWCKTLNSYCEREGIAVRFDARSLKEQGIEREAQIHEGPRAQAMAAAGKELAASADREKGDRVIPYTVIDDGGRVAFNTTIKERNARRELVKGVTAAKPQFTGQRTANDIRVPPLKTERGRDRQEAMQKQALRDQQKQQRSVMYEEQRFDSAALRQLADAEKSALQKWAADAYAKARQEAQDAVGAEFGAKWSGIDAIADPREKMAKAAALREAQSQSLKSTIAEKIGQVRAEKNKRHHDMKAAQETKRQQLRTVHREEQRAAVNQHGAERTVLHGAWQVQRDLRAIEAIAGGSQSMPAVQMTQLGMMKRRAKESQAQAAAPKPMDPMERASREAAAASVEANVEWRRRAAAFAEQRASYRRVAQVDVAGREMTDRQVRTQAREGAKEVLDSRSSSLQRETSTAQHVKHGRGTGSDRGSER